MDIYKNDCLSLPEQVENNRENIELLFGSIGNNEMVLSHEILLKNLCKNYKIENCAIGSVVDQG